MIPCEDPLSGWGCHWRADVAFAVQERRPRAQQEDTVECCPRLGALDILVEELPA